MVEIQYYINVHGGKYSTILMYIHMGVSATVIQYSINVVVRLQDGRASCKRTTNA